MNRHINFILNRPKTIIRILMLITLLWGIGTLELEFNNTPDVMMPKEDIRYMHNFIINPETGKNIQQGLINNILEQNRSKSCFLRLLDIEKLFQSRSSVFT